MIGVGIHENVVVSSVTRNDRGTLVIKFKKIDEVDPIKLLQKGITEIKSEESDFLIYPIKTTNYDGTVKTKEQILSAIAELVDPLKHILDNLEIDVVINPIKDMEITSENFYSTLSTQENLDKIYENVVSQFIKAIDGKVGDNTTKFRVVFPRSSQAKHYPKLRTKYLGSQPFMERMDVPAQKVKFSKYEIEKGLDKGDKVGSNQQVSSQEASAAEKLFN